MLLDSRGLVETEEGVEEPGLLEQPESEHPRRRSAGKQNCLCLIMAVVLINSENIIAGKLRGGNLKNFQVAAP